MQPVPWGRLHRAGPPSPDRWRQRVKSRTGPFDTKSMAGTIGTIGVEGRVNGSGTRAPRRGRRAVTLLAALAAVLMLSGVLTSCETTDADRGEVVSLINITRSQNGLAPLAENVELNVKADAWAARLRDECRIFHSRLADGAPPSWQKLGENVGRGGTIYQVHGAYLGSAGHRRNILDPAFNQVGAGAVWGNCNGYRMVFTVQVFMKG